MDFLFCSPGFLPLCICTRNCRFIKIKFCDITHLEGRENYVLIHKTNKKNITHRSTFTHFLDQLPANDFVRVHRSFAVQINLIENIENTGINIAGTNIPISQSYKEDLFTKLNIPF